MKSLFVSANYCNLAPLNYILVMIERGYNGI